MIDCTLFLAITLALSITFSAYTILLFLSFTFQTRPNPPFPIILSKLNIPLQSIL